MFQSIDGLLHCEEVPLDDLAGALGTPQYVYSLGRVRANYRRIAAAFADLEPSIHYSLKANADLALVRTLLAEGAGLDAVSGGEIYRALAAGADPREIVFAGVGKTSAEIDYALKVGVGCFNVESTGELIRLNDLARASGQRATVALRLNPDVQAQTHHYIATGHAAAKFGMGEAELRTLLQSTSRYPALDIKGVHVHIGSQLGDSAQTAEAARHALGLFDDFPGLSRLNMGGGFPVPYTDEDYPPVDDFARSLATLLAGRSIQLSLEPGRYIVADAGALIVEVQYVKQVGDTRILVVDGGMTELIRPALYGAVHPVQPLRHHGGPLTPAQVVGPICESSDVLRSDALLPTLAAGDRLAIMMAGAYGAVMGSTYNARPRAPEVVVDGAAWKIARRRESWDDLTTLER